MSLIEFRDGKSPESPIFGDIYFDRDQGLAETRYVFLEQNKLLQRWSGQRVFSIGELGFGTGLNFLATWKVWKDCPQRPEKLHFVSCEKHPLSRADIQKSLEPFSEIQPFLKKFLETYQCMPWGTFRFEFEEGRVALTLLFGDVIETFRETEAYFDAWYLDGFAPAKNQRMWSDEALELVAKKSKGGTSFATFSAAGRPQRKLKALGFEVEKFKGFGRKREMIRGEMSAPKRSDAISEKVLVVGAGLAGCSVAYQLARRGISVTLIEEKERIATRASGNPRAILVPSLTAFPSAISAASLQSFVYSHHLIQNLSKHFDFGWLPCGSLYLLDTPQKEARLDKALRHQKFSPDFLERVDNHEASKIAGLKLSTDAIYFKLGGVLDPRRFCEALLKKYSSNIDLKTKTRYEDIDSSAFDRVIFTNAYAAVESSGYSDLAIEKIRGQVIELDSSGSDLDSLRTVLYGNAYLTPSSPGRALVGATFDKSHLDAVALAADTEELLKNLEKTLPELKISSDRVRAERAEIRTHTKSRLPFFSPLDAKQKTWILCGLGSKGLSYSLYLAEDLANELSQEPKVIQTSVRALMDKNSKKFLDWPPPHGQSGTNLVSH